MIRKIDKKEIVFKGDKLEASFLKIMTDGIHKFVNNPS